MDEWQDAEGVGVDGVDHDGDEVDLTGLMESIVDSDEEEDLAESIDVMIHFLSHTWLPFVTLARWNQFSWLGPTFSSSKNNFPISFAEPNCAGHGSWMFRERSIRSDGWRHRNPTRIHATPQGIRKYDSIGKASALSGYGFRRRRKSRHSCHERRRRTWFMVRYY